ncbi:exodeoxyribonuclease 7 large subunit [Streptococcus urinalis FB127-CNA-2]|uniref:Exodeoxyribonuclease 7 large subunit n=1 Tax=Streptococcus urinalis 2285-97 TaxID=764291 RepID=G5KD77_9STRE|nr:exodeoxyribonuclease VII large subunit [Streptococcus urinalis]EHJ57789.1 exodeoxyribonuclease VII, large subunit [Streptococcus urinalis 2285-97]EKS19343.1 exodeoxyribonuclease 7 large subunit [Streptococcus urinalis FB127-CNA-2]VEF31473.1 exodeoxyribonuclease VII large subunit [Streptococcus urinalis]
MPDYLTVSHLTKYLKLKFERDPYLERVYLSGQVSNFRRRPNHQYFSLKDENAVIQATMWGSSYKKLCFDLEEGMKINVVGRVQLYEPGGSYSIIIESAQPDGIGALAVQFEQLKKKLTQAGYFLEQHKQQLPQFVSKVGVVTSSSGAVIRDIITTISRRFSGVEIILYPTKVQGQGAAEEIVKNIRRANERQDLDVLIIGRGGGSIEDLWAFNEEIVVEAIFESRLPIISSVGHETDTTLSDFVADKRAATPTAAAELATPVTKSDLLTWLSERQNRSFQAVLRQITIHRERTTQLSNSVIFRQPMRLYDAYIQKLDQLSLSLNQSLKNQVQTASQNINYLDRRLKAINPQQGLVNFQDKLRQNQKLLMSNMTSLYDTKLARFEKAQDTLLSLDTGRIVSRGYAIIKQNEQIISSTKQIKQGDHLMIEMKDGHIKVEVEDVNN